MATVPITRLQILAGNSQVRRVGLNNQCPLVNFPVNTNPCSRLKPIIRFNKPCVSNGVANLSSRGKGMSKWHEIELMVRDYELDQYGVVNNAVYSNYCLTAHCSLLESLGITSYAIDYGAALALSELSLKFISPLKSRDRFLIRVRVTGWTGVRLRLQDEIIKLPNQQPILEANAVGVWLDKNMRPRRPPREAISALRRFIDEADSQDDDISEFIGRNFL